MTTPANSWKNFYSARGMSADARAKYGVTDRSPYTYTEEAIENELKDKNDITKKNLVKQ